MDNQRFFSGVGLISVSLALHGALFFSLNQEVSHIQAEQASFQRNFLKEKGERLEFQFIEAPSETPKPAKKTKRMSNRNALNQDMLKIKSSSPAALPHTAMQGAADQLAQYQGNLSQTPSPKTEAKQAIEKQETENKPEETKPAKSVLNDDQAFLFHEKIENKKTKNQPSNKNVNEQKPSPSSSPRAEIQGKGGFDRITTQEMSKIKSPGAMLFGQTSFEATGSGMGEYMKNLKERIWLSWFPYLAYQYPQDFRGADVVISFTLDPKGNVKIVKILDSVGSPVFAAYCVEAVQKASGFGPLPKEILTLIGKDELEIKFGFHYR